MFYLRKHKLKTKLRGSVLRKKDRRTRRNTVEPIQDLLFYVICIHIYLYMGPVYVYIHAVFIHVLSSTVVIVIIRFNFCSDYR